MKSIVFATAIVAAFVVNVASANSNCFLYTACSSCAGSKSCGWDADMAKCKAGTVYGPNIGSTNNWEWSLDQCKAAIPSDKRCSTYTHCSTCAMASSGCGWDSRTLKCMAGSSKGPTNPTTGSSPANATASGSAASQEWVWTEGNCPKNPSCSQYTSCSQCTISPSGQCGWDSASQSCKLGTAHGPAGSTLTPSTTKANWQFTSAQCRSHQNKTHRGAGPDPSSCGGHSTCHNCTMSLSGFCGWTGFKCLSGAAGGPSNAAESTSFWGWTSEQCAMSGETTNACSTSSGSWLCGGITNCMDCVKSQNDAQIGGCNWDVDRGKCTATTSIKDRQISSGQSSYCYNGATECSNHQTCDTCTVDDSGLCGWDAYRQTCTQGSERGPVRGQTRQWVWKQPQCPIYTQCSDMLSCAACQGNAIQGEVSQHNFGSNSNAVSCAWILMERPKLNGQNWVCASGMVVMGSCGNNDHEHSCIKSTTCMDCTEKAGCGWDYNAQMCTGGTAIGPNSGKLPRQWDFTADQCATHQCGGQCEALASCDTCSGMVNCGWDTNGDECRRGNINGPFYPTNNDNGNTWDGVSSTAWFYGQAQCHAVDCDSFGSCHDCAGQAGCGWTGDGGCARGNSVGMYNNFAENAQWDQTTAQCGFTWTWRWSKYSVSMWMTMSFTLILTVGSCMWIRRRNKKLAVLHRAGQGAAANMGALLLNSAAAPTTASVAGANVPQQGTALYGATAPAAGQPPATYPYGNAQYAPGAAPPVVVVAMDTQTTDSIGCMPMMEEIE